MPALSFDQPVPDNGYKWWYVDAVSDDNKHALTVIVFIGSVFSPYYARARKAGLTPATEHCAINVALYGKPWRWSMTERTQASMKSSATSLAIGKSCISASHKSLNINIDEVAVPFPSRLRGSLSIDLPELQLAPHPLDAANSQNAAHFWQPVAPQTRISVKFDNPSLVWSGNAYIDSNYGGVPLESSFKSWVWSRSHLQDGSTDILYDVVARNGTTSQRSLSYAADGALSTFSAQQTHRLPATRYWRVPRKVRTSEGSDIKNLQTLEDTPFYSRSRFTESANGQEKVTMHESLYLERFDTSWVRCLLPFRMPRRTRALLLD